jgi:hypothetical protein
VDEAFRVAAIVGPLVGIAIGWFLNQRTTRETTRMAFENQKSLAQQSLEGQRRLASDAAKRERRRILMDRYMAEIRERVQGYQELAFALARHDWERCLALFDELVEARRLMSTLADVQATGDPLVS